VAICQVLANIPIPELIGFEKDFTNTFEINPVIKGSITEVYNNNTVQLNGTLNVKLSFIKQFNEDPLKQEDSTHYASVMCPIRSPAIIYVESHITNQPNSTSKTKDDLNHINGILFCQTTDLSDTLKNSSINEDLISSNVSSLDNSSCKNFKKMIDSIKQAFGCR